MNSPYSVWMIAAAVVCLNFGFAHGSEKVVRAPKGREVQGTLLHDGLKRTYIVHIPPQYNESTAAPLVLFFHGGGGNAKQAMKAYGWNEKSDAEGFLVVYPNGTGKGNLLTWNAMNGCGSAHEQNIDDVGFVKELVAQLQKTYSVDASRVYSTGMSNGAFLTYRLAAELPELFAAAAPVAGTIGGKENAFVKEKIIPVPDQPVPLVIFHGKEDTNVHYNGGKSDGIEKRRIDLSVADAIKFWTAANGCTTTPVTELLANGDAIKDFYASDTGADVLLYSIVDGSHEWPIAGRNSVISATDLAWDFFTKHARK